MQQLKDQVGIVAARISAQAEPKRRRLVAIAGPPASGKSTFAAALVTQLGAQAVLTPMDGFHLDNRLLKKQGLLARKGAPETFDGHGFIHAMGRLRDEPHVFLPSFDRDLDLSIAGAVEVSPQHRIAVVEGNYLLFNAAPWQLLHKLWDLSVWIAPPEGVLRQRLIDRWIAHGLDEKAATARAETNDLPNARQIMQLAQSADISF